jgi:hypothetical protein
LPDFFVGTNDSDTPVLSTRKLGDAFPRLVITGDGEIRQGDGTVPPSEVKRVFGESLDDGQMVIPRLIANGSVSMTSGTVVLTSFVGDKSEPITKISASTWSTAAGATPTLCKMGVYSIAANGDATLVASCANDTTLFNGTFGWFQRNLTSTWNKVEGQRYAAATLVVSGATMPTMHGISNLQGTDIAFLPFLSMSRTGQTDLPASILFSAMVSYGGAIQYAFRR